MKIDKFIKNNKKNFYQSQILLIIALVFFLLSSIVLNNETKIKDYSELLMLGNDKENAYVILNINSLPYYVVKKNSNKIILKYYIALDSDNYMYLIRLTDETYQKIETMYYENPDDFSYSIKGYIFTTPKELKTTIIESYNAIAETDILTLENFNQYFGKTYLDENNIPYLNSSVFLKTAAVIILIIYIIITIIYFRKTKNIKKLIKFYDPKKIEKELSSKKVKYFSNLNLYLTNNYIFINKIFLKIIPYKEIIWVYIEENNYHKIFYYYSLIIYLTSGKRIIVKSFNNNDFFVIIQKISKKNKLVLLGYSKINKRKYKQSLNKVHK